MIISAGRRGCGETGRALWHLLLLLSSCYVRPALWNLWATHASFPIAISQGTFMVFLYDPPLTSVHCWGIQELCYSYAKNSLPFPQNFKWLQDPAIPLLGIYQENWKSDSNMYMYTCVYSNGIHSSQNEKAMCPSTDEWVNKMFHNGGLLYSDHKRCSADKCPQHVSL